jgi:UDP-2,3-diacylglucosamine pyrophosphatase LpxH
MDSIKMHYKSLFVSDIHLGTKQCQVQYLLKFIHDNTFDNVFLLGDVIDIQALSHKWYWAKEHNTFIQKVLRLSRHGVHVCFLPGNHDAIIREWIKDMHPFFFGDIIIVDQHVYQSVKGKKILLMHGDEFDGAIRSMGWLYFIGDRAYDLALWINTVYNWWRKLFGFSYWSLSAYLKSKVKGAIEVINNFEELVTRKCLINGYEGVIFGHTHTPVLKTVKTKLIMNDGDSCENMTCIVETEEGVFQLIRMTDNKILQTIE